MNVTYTAVDGGLVAWLNDQTARYASSTVHVTLPSGNVARGAAPLELPSGLNLILQGQGMAGASSTTLDLEKQNLDVGGMLGEGGRIEFRNMRVRNVRPSRACAAVHVLWMTPWLVCAGLCGAPAPARRRPMRAPAVLRCPLVVVCAACFMHRAHARAARDCGALHRLVYCVVVLLHVVCCASCGVLHRCVLHRCAYHVASVRVACCIGDAQPSCSAPAVRCVAWCAARGRCRIRQRAGFCGGRAAARCARAQSNGGGVLSMDTGTALFDTVAISGTDAGVRAGRGGVASRADAHMGRV